jgi:hypothetical protein
MTSGRMDLSSPRASWKKEISLSSLLQNDSRRYYMFSLCSLKSSYAECMKGGSLFRKTVDQRERGPVVSQITSIYKEVTVFSYSLRRTLRLFASSVL